MSSPTCAQPSCTRAATIRVSGTKLPEPLHVCDDHHAWATTRAGVPHSSELIRDDAQEALFDMPAVVKRMGLR